MREGSQRRGVRQWGVEREQSINPSIHQNFKGRGGYRQKRRQTLTVTLAQCPHDVRNGNAAAPAIRQSPRPSARPPGRGNGRGVGRGLREEGGGALEEEEDNNDNDDDGVCLGCSP